MYYIEHGKILRRWEDGSYMLVLGVLAEDWLGCGARILNDMAYTIELHIEWHKR